MASPGAVAIIETPNSFLVEERPDLPGQLAYAGRLQLFGGHADADESAEEAINRELWEELRLQDGEVSQLWSGEFDGSQNRRGERVTRLVTLFRVVVGSVAELDLQVPGAIVEIPKTAAGVAAHEDRLTPFALWALRQSISGEWLTDV